MLLKWEKTK